MECLIVLLISTASQDPSASSFDRVLRRIDSQKITVDFRDTILTDAIGYFRETTGLNFVLDPRTPGADRRVSLQVHDLSVRSVLRLTLNGSGLAAVFREGAIVVVPREQVTTPSVLRIYDVRDLRIRIEDFPGPKIDLAVDRPGIDIDGCFGFDEPRQRIQADFLLELLKESCPGWEKCGGSMELVNGLLVVTATSSRHRSIREMLDRLRECR